MSGITDEYLLGFTGGQTHMRNPSNPALSDYAYAVLTRFIPASEFIPRVTSGPGVASFETGSNLNNFDSTDFDGGTAEFQDAIILLPSAGNFRARFFWTSTSSPGSIVFSVAAVALNDGTAIDVAMGASQKISDTIQAANVFHWTDVTPEVAVAGSPVAGSPALLRVGRATVDADDTATSIDARFLGVFLQFNP